MSKAFLVNLMLALVWTTVTGILNSTNLLLGFVVGYFILVIAQPLIDVSSYHRRLWALTKLGLYFLVDLLLASIRMAKYIMSPIRHLESGVIAVPLDLKTDLEITVFASLISLTPGSLTLDHSRDRRFLYIHIMDIQGRDVEGERRRIKEGLESRVHAAFGPDTQ